MPPLPSLLTPTNAQKRLKNTEHGVTSGELTDSLTVALAGSDDDAVVSAARSIQDSATKLDGTESRTWLLGPENDTPVRVSFVANNPKDAATRTAVTASLTPRVATPSSGRGFSLSKTFRFSRDNAGGEDTNVGDDTFSTCDVGLIVMDLDAPGQATAKHGPVSADSDDGASEGSDDTIGRSAASKRSAQDAATSAAAAGLGAASFRPFQLDSYAPSHHWSLPSFLRAAPEWSQAVLVAVSRCGGEASSGDSDRWWSPRARGGDARGPAILRERPQPTPATSLPSVRSNRVRLFLAGPTAAAGAGAGPQPPLSSARSRGSAGDSIGASQSDLPTRSPASSRRGARAFTFSMFGGGGGSTPLPSAPSPRVGGAGSGTIGSPRPAPRCRAALAALDSDDSDAEGRRGNSGGRDLDCPEDALSVSDSDHDDHDGDGDGGRSRSGSEGGSLRSGTDGDDGAHEGGPGIRGLGPRRRIPPAASAAALEAHSSRTSLVDYIALIGLRGDDAVAELMRQGRLHHELLILPRRGPGGSCAPPRTPCTGSFRSPSSSHLRSARALPAVGSREAFRRTLGTIMTRALRKRYGTRAASSSPAADEATPAAAPAAITIPKASPPHATTGAGTGLPPRPPTWPRSSPPTSGDASPSSTGATVGSNSSGWPLQLRLPFSPRGSGAGGSAPGSLRNALRRSTTGFESARSTPRSPLVESHVVPSPSSAAGISGGVARGAPRTPGSASATAGTPGTRRSYTQRFTTFGSASGASATPLAAAPFTPLDPTRPLRLAHSASHGDAPRLGAASPAVATPGGVMTPAAAAAASTPTATTAASDLARPPSRSKALRGLSALLVTGPSQATATQGPAPAVAGTAAAVSVVSMLSPRARAPPAAVGPLMLMGLAEDFEPEKQQPPVAIGRELSTKREHALSDDSFGGVAAPPFTFLGKDSTAPKSAGSGAELAVHAEKLACGQMVDVPGPGPAAEVADTAHVPTRLLCGGFPLCAPLMRHRQQ